MKDRELRDLLIRARAAIDAPNDLSPDEREFLAQDLDAAARELEPKRAKL